MNYLILFVLFYHYCLYFVDSEASSIMEIENVILAKMHDDQEDHSDAILKSEKFQQDLFFMERVLMENIFQPKLAAYRQLPILKGIGRNNHI